MTIIKKSLIIFDAMGVIYPFPEGNDVEYGIFAFLENKGYEFTNKQKNHWDKEKGYNQATRGQMSSTEALKILLPSKNNQEIQKLEKEYLSSAFFCLAEDFISTVQILKNEFLIAMLSNDIPNWSLDLRKRFDIEKYFDLFIISGDGNPFRKPEKEIYEYLLKQIKETGMEVDQIFFIDDSLKNLRTASLFKIKTIYKILKSNDSVDYTPDYKVNRLSELLKILPGTENKT